MRRLLGGIGLCWLLLNSAVYAAQYSVTVVDNPRPVSLSGINDAGQIVGSAYQSGSILLDAYYWQSPHQGMDLGRLGCSYENEGECYSKAFDLNNNGVVIGESHTHPGYAYLPVAFRWENGAMEQITTVGVEFSRAQAINNRGTITGFGRATYNYSYVSQAYVRFNDGQTVGLWGAASGLASFAYGINDNDTAAGCYTPLGYLLTPGYWSDNGSGQYQLTALPAPGSQACVEAINDQNVMAGYAIDSTGAHHGAVWENEQFTDLGTLGVYVNYSHATAINNAKQVVGHYSSWQRLCRPTCRTKTHALGFIWENGAMTALDNLMAEPDVYVTDAFDINDSGQIAASGIVNGSAEFLILMPVP